MLVIAHLNPTTIGSIPGVGYVRRNQKNKSLLFLPCTHVHRRGAHAVAGTARSPARTASSFPSRHRRAPPCNLQIVIIIYFYYYYLLLLLSTFIIIVYLHYYYLTIIINLDNRHRRAPPYNY